MDGAKYHKRITNPVSSAKSRKHAIKDCLTANSIQFDLFAVKASLLLLVQKPKAIYAAQLIAIEEGTHNCIPIPITLSYKPSS
jgi:hypothetical protein